MNWRKFLAPGAVCVTVRTQEVTAIATFNRLVQVLAGLHLAFWEPFH
jgi:hypothetical protein